MSNGGGFLVLLFLIFYVIVILWTYADARENSPHPAFLWALVVFLTPLLGLVLYLLLGRTSSSTHDYDTHRRRGRY